MKIARSTMCTSVLLATLFAIGCGEEPSSTADDALRFDHVTVTVSPTTATLAPGGSQAFTCAVSRTSERGCTWSTTGASGGTITTDGVYTAPSTPGVYAVVARSTANPAAAGTATITVTAAAPQPEPTPTPTPAPVPVAPVVASFSAAPSSVYPGQATTLAWSVTGATALSIDQGIGAVTGSSRQVSPFATTTYTLTAQNAAGAVTAATTVLVDAVDVTTYRADPTGTADSAAAFDAAFTAAAGRPVFVPRGVYRIASARTLRGNTVLYGDGATLLFDFVGIGMQGTGVRFEAHGVTFDGNDKATALVKLNSATVHIDGCTFRNTYATAGVSIGLYTTGPTTGTITNSTFTRLRSLGNGVVGDQVGVARGIIVTSATPPPQVTISNNSFTQIHSVDASGKPIMEDADAVHVTEGLDALVTVDGNSFYDVGKRGIKFQCNRAVARNNLIVSAWPDASKVMFSGISVFGNSITVQNNTIRGSYLQFGIDLSTAGRTGVVVDGNTIDASGTFSETGPFGQRSAIFTVGQVGLRVTNNRVSNFRNGVLVRGGSGALVSGNTLTNIVVGTLVEDGTTTATTVSGNTITGRANTAGHIGSQFPVGATGSIAGNTYRTLYDGIYVGGNVGVAIASDNTFADIGRANVFR